MNKKKDTREIYSIQDFQDILDEVLEEELGLGCYVIQTLLERVENSFRYVNWTRFQRANCPGCVSGPKECDIAYGRKEFYGIWAKIVNGKIQSCPARVNGTMMFDTKKPEEGLRTIDISDHVFNVVKLLEPIEEQK